MLAFARRSRPLSSINSNLLIPAALQSLETLHHAFQQGGWCALQQALLHAGHTDHRGQASVLSVRENSYHVSAVNWGTPSLGHRCYSTQQPRAVNAVSQGNTRSFDPVSLSNLTPGKRKYKRRRARGGGDKQAGRGFNGQKSRSGTVPSISSHTAMSCCILHEESSVFCIWELANRTLWPPRQFSHLWLCDVQCTINNTNDA